MSKPLCVDLFCGVGGATEGALLEGYDCVGFDIERHVYGEHKYPAQLVIQDILTIHGSQFKDAAMIWASPPCQEYSYMAMPWSLAKAKAAAIRADTTGAEIERLNRLFNACFRIQREACEAAGRHVPMVVENVRGAIPWVGRSRWNFGSFHLWGDVPALMPITLGRSVMKQGIAHRPNGETNFHGHGQKVPGFRFDGSGKTFQSASVEYTGVKVPSEEGRRTDSGKCARFTSRDCGIEGVKGYVPTGTKALGKHGHPRILPQIVNKTGSGTPQRKMASAMIAKIPLPLSRWIAATFFPREA